MRNSGSTFEYAKERNEDIMRAYVAQIQSSDVIKLPVVLDRVVNTPTKRFWVSPERAAIVVSRIIKGDSLIEMRPPRREMFFEIYRRVKLLRKEDPSASLYSLVFRVVQEPAPKFYLTPGSAKVIIHRVKKEWYERNKQRLYRLRYSQL
ncbi:MAG: hypothetical protein IIX79_05205 [Alistipes sp.]|jgi:hypothetical protein|nr:hypothetical protein [Alistipes sp.]MBQ1981075.1 hypothetical protein [Alistipes sp.]